MFGALVHDLHGQDLAVIAADVELTRRPPAEERPAGGKAVTQKVCNPRRATSDD